MIPRWEYAAYVGAFLVAVLPHVGGLVSGSYNATGLSHLCYFSESPYNCHKEQDVECSRGANANLLLIPSMVVFVVASLVGISATVWVYWTVRKTLQQSMQWRFAATAGDVERNNCKDRNNTNNNPPPLPPTEEETTTTTAPDDTIRNAKPNSERQLPPSSSSKRISNKTLERIKLVRTQAILYTCVFLNTFAWNSANAILENVVDDSCQDGHVVVYTFTLLAWVMFPFQGALNFVVYVRPTYKAWRDYSAKKKALTRWQCLQRAAWSHEAVPTS